MGWVVNATPRPLYSREGDPVPILLVDSNYGPQSQSGQVRKISPTPGFDPQSVQTVASHTDYTIPAPERHQCCYCYCYLGYWSYCYQVYLGYHGRQFPVVAVITYITMITLVIIIILITKMPFVLTVTVVTLATVVTLFLPVLITSNSYANTPETIRSADISCPFQCIPSHSKYSDSLVDDFPLQASFLCVLWPLFSAYEPPHVLLHIVRKMFYYLPVALLCKWVISLFRLRRIFFYYSDSYADQQLIGRYISKRTPSQSICGIVR